MSDLVQRLRDDAANGATAYAKENYLEAADEIETLERLLADRHQVINLRNDTVHRQADEIERQTKDIERLNGIIGADRSIMEQMLQEAKLLQKRLAEARADYDHELIMRQDVEADLAYIRRRTGFTGEVPRE